MSPVYEKMRLPGETPWGEVMERFDDDTVRLRIANNVGGLHAYRQDDIVLCELDEDLFWVPVDQPQERLH